MGIESIDGIRVAVTIPAGGVVKVLSGSTEDARMVNVHWNGRVVAIFTDDLYERGTEIKK